MDQETKRLSQQIDAFYQVSRFVDSIDDLENLLELIMREAESAVGAEAACIAIFDPSDERLHIKFASGEKSEEVRDVSLALGQGILGEAAAKKETVRVDSAEQDPRFEASVDEKTHFTTRSILATPIRRRDTLLGVIEVINKKGEQYFGESDAHLLEIVASQAAIAIENARLLERTLQSDRLSMVGKMASGIIHDFKTPLSLIQGFVELLTDADIPEEKRQFYSKKILDEVSEFSGSAQSLLDFARGGAHPNFEEVQLDDWVYGVSGVLSENLAKYRIALATDLRYQSTAWIDREKMRRVIMNLAANAKDAMPRGGTFTISTAREDENWRLGFADTGSGIPPEQRSKIFDLFATFGKQNGTGLGLAMVSDIVKGHAGGITVESTVAGEKGDLPAGTVFYITAPASPPISAKA